MPVVNPDGFNISREAPTLGDFSLLDYEMKRKNCSISETTPQKYANRTCENNNAGRLRGTDPNRNYGGLWGGSGASLTWFDDTFRGDAPFSEPEIQNIRELISARQVTNLITNHTYSNLVLRPPGVASFGFPLEEPEYKALGASLAAHNGYSNIPGFGLYDTTGATEDWSFWSTGGQGAVRIVSDSARDAGRAERRRARAARSSGGHGAVQVCELCGGRSRRARRRSPTTSAANRPTTAWS